jgi:hypothetical protein
MSDQHQQDYGDAVVDATEEDLDKAFSAALGDDAAPVDRGDDQQEKEGGKADDWADEKPEGPTIESLEKALKDTQRWGHEQSQALADMRKELEGLRNKAATEKEQEDEIPEDLKGIYEDFPELPKAIEREIERRRKGEPQQVPDYLRPENEFQEAVLFGYETPDGQWVPGNPQAKRVFNTQGFQGFLQNELKSRPELAQSNDPRDMIDLVNRYTTGKPAGDDQAKQQAAKQQSAKDAFRDGITPGTAPTSVTGESSESENDLDRIFNEAVGNK